MEDNKRLILEQYCNILLNNNILSFCDNLCKKCSFCNNCLFCDLNKRITNIINWFEYIIKNNIPKNEIEEKYIYKFIELKTSASFHFIKSKNTSILNFNFEDLFNNFNNSFKFLIDFCNKIIVNCEFNNIKINDIVIVELFNNILQNILKVKSYLLSLIIINDIKNNNVCKYINNNIIDNILLYFNKKENLILNFINYPDFYIDYLTNLFYIDYIDNINNL